MRKKWQVIFTAIVMLLFYMMIRDNVNEPIPEVPEDVEVVVPKEDCWLPVETSSDKTSNFIKGQFKKRKGLKNSTKIILLYTGLFFSPHWWGHNEKEIQVYTKSKNCEIKDCYFTYRKNALQVADLVIFHGVDLNKPYCLKRLSDARAKNQRWLFFMHESPQYTQDLRMYNKVFNWTMTYMQESDIYVPYFTYERLSSSSATQGVKKDFAAGKTGKVVWVVSHCDLIRDDYALELEKYIDVVVYGDCGKKFKNNMGRCSDWGNFCEEELKKYKFYLSFENCFCKDYITEKYWEKSLKYGLIPIVMGAVDKRTKIIKNSFINVNDFESVQELAGYLLYLDRNDTAYNEYFKWRYQYKVSSGVDALCEACKAINSASSQPTVQSRNIAKFWSKSRNCGPYEWKVNQIKMQISRSKFKFRNGLE